MIIDNFDKILGLWGAVIGIEIIAALIFTFSLIYVRNPQIAGLIGNFSSIFMTCGLIAVFLKKDV